VTSRKEGSSRHLVVSEESTWKINFENFTRVYFKKLLLHRMITKQLPILECGRWNPE